MLMLGPRLALFFRNKKFNAFGGFIGGLVAALVTTGAFLAAMAVSNILTFGPITVEAPETATPGPSVPAVTLTEIQGLPSSVDVGAEYDIEFRIQATEQVNDATLRVQLRSESASLNDPAVASIEYRNKNEGGSRKSVPLTAVNGELNGSLKSQWEIPAGYDDTGELRLSFPSSDAASISYFVDIWVESATGSGSTSAPIPGGRTFEVQATDQKTFSPRNLTVSVGDTVRWTSGPDKPHTVTFAAGSVITGRPISNLLGSGQSFQETFNTVGTFNYLCQLHDGMVGTVTVNQ